MRVVVDLAVCQGYAQYAFLAPDAFRLSGPEGLIYGPGPADGLRDRGHPGRGGLPGQGPLDRQAQMFGYVTDLVRRHREHPDGAMLSNLANDTSHDVMTDAELGTTSVLLLVARARDHGQPDRQRRPDAAAPPRRPGPAAQRS
jgi:hypothetical protein